MLSLSLSTSPTNDEDNAVAGKCLTNQWSFNTGKKYHYVVDQPSIAFSSDDTDRKEGEKVAPGYVKEAKEVLEKVCRDVIEEKEEEWGGFNEVLSVAYSAFCSSSSQWVRGES